MGEWGIGDGFELGFLRMTSCTFRIVFVFRSREFLLTFFFTDFVLFASIALTSILFLLLLLLLLLLFVCLFDFVFVFVCIVCIFLFLF